MEIEGSMKVTRVKYLLASAVLHGQSFADIIMKDPGLTTENIIVDNNDMKSAGGV